MLTACPVPAGTDPHRRDVHCLHLVAEAAANALLRVLEPFVIHDVLPLRIETRTEADALHVAIHFHAPADVAERLRARLSVMVAVCHAELLLPSARTDIAA